MSRLREDWQKKVKEISQFPIIGRKITNEKEEKYLREIATYEFYNLEEPGLTHTFGYASGKDSVTITLFHGGTYQMPRFIAEHLERCSIPIWDWRPDGTGAMTKNLVGRKPRFRLTQKNENKF
jgi:hypothetical protein